MIARAQAALGVDSAYRGQGLAELLYQRLVETARSYGVEFFHAAVSLRRANDMDELASLGLQARPLGPRTAELHWPLDASRGPSGLVPLLGLLERAVVGPPGEPYFVTGAHWID